MSAKKKILLICGDGNSVINFRKELILSLLESNYDVSIVVGNEKRCDEIKKLGIDYYFLPFSNRNTNPFLLLSLIRKLKKLIKIINPYVVFTFQATPNIAGGLASCSCKVKYMAMIEGLGDPFQPSNFKGRVLRMVISNLYKKSLSRSRIVFFLNNDDKQEFINKKIVEKNKAFVINGIGINTKLYSPNFSSESNRIICLSRLIKNKGIFDFCEVARSIKQLRSDVAFELYGEETCQIRKKDIQEFIDDDSIKYFGYTNNPRQAIADSKILVSFSTYREGFPMVILEAMALGKPVIAYDTIGSRDAVIDDVTGFLIPCHDKKSFLEKIIFLLNNSEKCISLGKKARHICETQYDSHIINMKIIDVINKECCVK